MEREIQSITRIQARIRGKQARDLMSYRRHAKELREKADDQADLIKRRMRSIAYVRTYRAQFYPITDWSRAASLACMVMCMQMRGGYDWRALFHQLDEDGSSMLCLGEFRRAVRQMHMTQQQVSDRELEILFKRMDNDGSGARRTAHTVHRPLAVASLIESATTSGPPKRSGEIDAPEFEAFLGQGPSAEAELRGCVTIQSRNRGRRVRRAHYTAQIEQRWVDVGNTELAYRYLFQRFVQNTDDTVCTGLCVCMGFAGRDDWKFEKLTDSRYCLWPTLCAALTPKLLPERGHQVIHKTYAHHRDSAIRWPPLHRGALRILRAMRLFAVWWAPWCGVVCSSGGAGGGETDWNVRTGPIVGRACSLAGWDAADAPEA
eukprot:SAG11_NODE_588_length_8329_cov_18.642857_4_plen_375_part_00